MKLSSGTKLRLSRIRSVCKNENGAALVIGLMFIAILAMLGSTAVVMTTTDMKIGANYKTRVQADNVAQAGINEALYRLGLFNDGGTAAPPSGSMININNIAGNNAAISIDPNNLLRNGNDDDGDGVKDEIDELNYNGTYDNRNWKAKIMLSSSAPAGLVANTTFFTNTIQPSGTWMEYSSSTDDGTALTIEFLKDTGDMDGDGNTSEIVFYNLSLANPYNVDTGATPATGQPIVVITSTGKTGGSISRIQLAAVHQPIDIQAEAAVMVDLPPTFSGSAIISGFDHYGYTDDTDAPNNATQWHNNTQFYQNTIDNHGGPEKLTGPPTVNFDDNTLTLLPPGPPYQEETVNEAIIPYGDFLRSSGHLPGVWSTTAPATVNPGGTAEIFGGSGASGSKMWKVELDDPTAWKTLAQLLGISQDALDRILAGANVTEADMDGSGQLTVAPQGVIYINNAGGTTLKITSATPANMDGWGLMYVTGDVSFGTTSFKGLIYVEGNASIAAGYWLMGCIAIKGTTSGNFSAGAAHFLYSSDILSSYVNRSMKFVPLTWKDDGLS